MSSQVLNPRLAWDPIWSSINAFRGEITNTNGRLQIASSLETTAASWQISYLPCPVSRLANVSLPLKKEYKAFPWCLVNSVMELFLRNGALEILERRDSRCHFGTHWALSSPAENAKKSCSLATSLQTFEGNDKACSTRKGIVSLQRFFSRWKKTTTVKTAEKNYGKEEAG